MVNIYIPINKIKNNKRIEKYYTNGFYILKHFNNHNHIEVIDKKLNTNIKEVIYFRYYIENCKTTFVEVNPDNKDAYENENSYITIGNTIKEGNILVNNNMNEVLHILLIRKLEVINKPVNKENLQKLLRIIEDVVYDELTINN